MEQNRRAVIKELYRPRHPNLTQFNPDYVLLPHFIEAVRKGTPESLMSILKKETPTGIYSFDIFTPQFCRDLLEEVENFEHSGLPISRPNSMNNYGVILDEIGFEEFLQRLMLDWLAPFARLLYPRHGASLDDHHGFIVQYKISEDTELGFHYDESEVTLNVCLGKTFEGGSLYFAGLLEDPSTHGEHFEFQHTPGRGILHIGKHRHGANPIRSGERYNLILWCRSSAMRAQQSHACTCCGDHMEEEEDPGSEEHRHEHQHQHEHDHEHEHHHHEHEHHQHEHDHADGHGGQAHCQCPH
jgi:hypothetical protein